LSFIPLIVTSSVGGSLLPHLTSYRYATGALLSINFLSWSLGEILCFIILAIYLWRLLACSLPPPDAIVSSFIPMGPTGLGAYSIQNLAVGLGTYVQQSSYLLSRGPQKTASAATIEAVAEGIHWTGVLIALFLVAFSTFWLAEAVCAVVLRTPKQFNAGFWSCVFPCGVYVIALSRLAQDLNNEGFRVWTAICGVSTILLWLGCACLTVVTGLSKIRILGGSAGEDTSEGTMFEESETTPECRVRRDYGTGSALSHGLTRS
jgi:tellurite resistance protein TehA-like permease